MDGHYSSFGDISNFKLTTQLKFKAFPKLHDLTLRASNEKLRVAASVYLPFKLWNVPRMIHLARLIGAFETKSSHPVTGNAFNEKNYSQFSSADRRHSWRYFAAAPNRKFEFHCGRSRRSCSCRNKLKTIERLRKFSNFKLNSSPEFQPLSFSLFSGVIYGFKGLILVFGLFLAYETRSIKVKQINDSRYVGMSIYNM